MPTPKKAPGKKHADGKNGAKPPSGKPAAKNEVAGDREQAPTRTSAGFPIVGIGAAADGLETFQQFFTNIVPDTGMAFVRVQHLDPTPKSIRGDLVKRYTRMPVLQVEDGMEVKSPTAPTSFHPA